MITLKTIGSVREYRQKIDELALVPTMGALHDGHLSLVRDALKDNANVMVSIYVNPVQFDSDDDLTSYPKTVEADIKILEEMGVDALFLPDDATIYPDGFSTSIKVGTLSKLWEGEFRPGHFEGVCTVVAKQFSITNSTAAYFGEKDYQQLQIIKRMTMDLNMPVKIVACATVRERDGLAMSSRNALLAEEHRPQASLLKLSMDRTAAEIQSGSSIEDSLNHAQGFLAENGFMVDYFAYVDGATLDELTSPTASARILVAAILGEVRLIDNISV